MDGTETRCLTEGAAPALDPTAAARAAEADRHWSLTSLQQRLTKTGGPARAVRAVLLAIVGRRTPEAAAIRAIVRRLEAVGAGGVAAPSLLPTLRPASEGSGVR